MLVRKRHNLLRTTVSEESAGSSTTGGGVGHLGSRSSSVLDEASAADGDEYLEYYRQYRNPNSWPDSYLSQRSTLDPAASPPIESYYHRDSHYHQRHPVDSGRSSSFDDEDRSEKHVVRNLPYFFPGERFLLIINPLPEIDNSFHLVFDQVENLASQQRF